MAEKPDAGLPELAFVGVQCDVSSLQGTFNSSERNVVLLDAGAKDEDIVHEDADTGDAVQDTHQTALKDLRG